MATKKPAKKSPVAPTLTAFEFDDTAYDIDRLARNAVLKHPAVQKRIESMKQKLTKHVNGHGGITAMRAEESVPKTNGAGTRAEGKLKGPGQTVSARMPRTDKLPKPKPRKASKTSY